MFSINYSVLSITIGVYECCMVLSVNTIICQFTTLCLLMLPNRVSKKKPSQTRLKKVTETRLIGSFKNKVLFVEKTYMSRNYFKQHVDTFYTSKVQRGGSCEKLEFRTIPSLLFRGYLKISLFQIPGLNFIYLYYESNYVSIWRCTA